jgi:acyl-CoA thioester hydrolase
MMTFSWPIRVYWEDTDAGGVVYHAQYLHFFERARSEWLRSAGISQVDLRVQDDCLLVVKSLSLDYARPARYDDELNVLVKMKHIGHASFMVIQELHRGSECLSRADVKIACLYSSSFKPRPLPSHVLAAAKAVLEQK